jgi:hypothetical protein
MPKAIPKSSAHFASFSAMMPYRPAAGFAAGVPLRT